MFFRALGGLIDGFSERAERVKALLADPATTFLLVTSPGARADRGGDLLLAQAARRRGMPFGGVRRQPRAPRRCPATPTPTSVAATLRGRARRQARRQGGRELPRLPRARPSRPREHRAPGEQLDDRRIVLVPHLDEDVHDVERPGAHQPLPVRLGRRARAAAQRDRRLVVDALLDGPAVSIARAVAAGDASPVELVDAALARIEERNPRINAVVAVRAATAREEAAAVERAAGAGEALGPLAGVPITVKESVALEGMPWTGGSRAFEGDVARADAPAVAGLRRAGAIPVGVTNTSELCMYYDSYNPLYGATGNPHDTSRSAGGSSGGEAASLAAGIVPLGVGSDLSGSIRFPAHLTGVFGFKPSGSTVAFRGHHPSWVPPPSFDLMAQIGPMTRHAEDLGPALEADERPQSRLRRGAIGGGRL